MAKINSKIDEALRKEVIENGVLLGTILIFGNNINIYLYDDEVYGEVFQFTDNDYIVTDFYQTTWGMTNTNIYNGKFNANEPYAEELIIYMSLYNESLYLSNKKYKEIAKQKFAELKKDYQESGLLDDINALLKKSKSKTFRYSTFESKESLKESINSDCYIYYDDDDNKRLVFCDYVKGITDTRDWFYLNEYIIDAIHIFKNEKQAQKFIDEHLKYFADQDKVVIAEYPQTVSGFFESKESARKSIKEERYNVELSDYSGSIVDEDSFDKKLDAIQWAKDNGRNCYARIWDNEEGKTVKEWKVKSIKESADDILTVKEFCFWGHSGNIVEIWTIDGVLCDTFEVRNVGKSEYKNYEIHGWDCAKNTVIIYIKK